MGFFLSNPFIVSVAFFTSLVLLYLQAPIKNIQQMILVIVVISFAANRFIKLPIIKNANIFFSSVAVWLLVLSSGGLKSPFLILIHLYTLGTSFLLGLVTSIIFLIFSVLILASQILIDENIRKIFFEDLGTVFLYGTSFLVVVPLSIFVSKLYFLKDKLLEVVKKELKQQKIQSQTLLKGVSDAILIIDKELNISSTNEAAQTELSMPASGIIGRPLFDVLFIREGSGKLANAQTLSIDRVIAEKSTRVIQGLKFLSKNRVTPRIVDIQVRPVLNLDGAVGQLMIIISGAHKISSILHPTLEDARLRHSMMNMDLKSLLSNYDSPQLKLRSELLGKASSDIAISAEIEDHTIIPNPTLVDIANLCLRNVSNTQEFARSLGVTATFDLINFSAADISPLIPKGFNISPQDLTGPYFTVPVDIKWFDILIQRLLAVASLCVSGIPNAKIALTIEREGGTQLIIRIIAYPTYLKAGEENLLTKEYYGDLSSKTNLRLGSGLEGFLANTIASYLDIPFVIEVKNSQVIFSLKISKLPKRQLTLA